MALKQVKITYNDKEEGVEFEDSMTFGDVEELVGESVDLSDVTKPRIDLKAYRMNLLVKVLKKAPFKTGDVTTLKLLDAKVVQTILRELSLIHI